MHLIVNPNGRDGGMWITFINGQGVECTSYWMSPPTSINHVDMGYLQGRYANVKNQRQADFIKREYTAKIRRALAHFD